MFFARKRMILVLLLASPFAACSSSSSPPQSAPPPSSGPDASTPGGHAVVRLALAGDALPAYLDVPFPSDVYLTGGHVTAPPKLDAVFTQGAEYIGHELAKMDGFSRVAPALFTIDDLGAPPQDDGTPASSIVDAASLPRDEDACTSDASSVYLVDLAATDPAKARVPCRAQVHDEANERAPHPLLAVGPARGVVLDEGHRYAAVVTSRAKDRAGNALAPSADFAKVAAGARPGAREQLYGDAYDAVARALAGALAKDGATVVAVAPFTTNAMTRELFAMREALEGAPDAHVSWTAADVAPMTPARFVAGATAGSFTATLDDWLGHATQKLPDGSDDPDDALPVRAHGALAAVGTAVFTAETYLQSKDGGYATLDHATFAHDASGNVVLPPDPTTKIWVTFAIPSAPAPASGYPVVIVQHGLNSSRAYLLDLADTFAKQGWASVAIDSVTFGARAPEPERQVDAASTFGGAYTGPDGLADKDGSGNTNGSNDMFGLLKNIGALRDQFREAAFDTAQLVKLLRSPALDLAPLATTGAAPKLDPSKIAYFGDSLGGIEGAVAAAIEPHVRAWALNVTGGGIGTEIVTHGPAINALARIAAGANFGILQSAQNESHPFTNMLQQIADPADPLAYASLLVKSPRSLAGSPIPPRAILQTEVLYDEVVANEGSEALARAGGWGLATPNAGSNSGIVDVKNIAANPGRVPLADVAPDGAGVIHDAPTPGTTAVLVQISPAVHGLDVAASHGKRQFCIPFAIWTDPDPFHHLDLDQYFEVRCPYRTTQAMIVRFFADAFHGDVPGVAVPAAPVRDFDDDGIPDESDPDPCKP